MYATPLAAEPHKSCESSKGTRMLSPYDRSWDHALRDACGARHSIMVKRLSDDRIAQGAQSDGRAIRKANLALLGGSKPRKMKLVSN